MNCPLCNGEMTLNKDARINASSYSCIVCKFVVFFKKMLEAK